jgi:peptide-methionine (S)-S-oxide reductase
MIDLQLGPGMAMLSEILMNRFAVYPDKPARWRALLAAIALPGFLVPVMNAQAQSSNAPAKMETATIGGGCFWCAEAVFQRIPGVKSVTSGFAGGTVPNPSYEQVCTGATGHAEVIQLKFDPAVLSYDKLLEIFWEAHDPTTLNRQGADHGTQYRSIILYSDDAQKTAAEASKARAAKRFKDPIVTQIVPLKAFYSAEDYHQNYYNSNKNQGYCQFVITPKLKKLISEGVIPQGKE